MNYLASYDTNVESAYIITLPGDETSEKLTQQCIQSCEAVGQPYKLLRHSMVGQEKSKCLKD